MKNAAFVLCLLLILPGCGGSKAVREEPAKLQDFAVEKRVKEVWTADSGASAVKKAVVLSPALDGDVLYTSDPKGRVRAFAADSGRQRWETHVSRLVTGATAAGDGLVVVVTKKGEVIALDRADGRRLWASNLSSQALAPPAISAGVVVVQSVDGKLTGLSAADGKRLWRYERTEPALSLYGTARPVIVADAVLTGFASGKVVAVQVRSGKLLWELPVAQPQGRNEVERLVDVDISPVVVRNVLYAASYQGKIIALDAQTGRILWSRDVSTFSGMDADANNIYLTDDRGNVLAFDQRTGASVWKQEQLRARRLNAPRYVDGLVAVGDFEGYVHWLSSDDGHFVARHRIGSSAVRSQVIVNDDKLYVSNQSGDLAALRLETN
ncbi:MAG: outer membrane protein assembly factor BamB [Candidatus Muproteobacteria bacterium RIFCSPHIGHO2_12_FULL_60_33]|nr:MAG: outer membrane protein assembly factor BamB [Candidatus Muproteobacteria bacterium RIFCSPHIGHO2_01_60_12]OGI54020.1 MAG: outer membrane protein assembly factor BamB [Candidatus Muproteobacteria bacterium RIFCSPHIGHO2_02_FULL_60_13]OGI55619.1 MAG: outer membrane protein assembly factor BamB [Candidatus Muproteobacteria bacterium RIFCSPHIGHO2_12_FULL_60_33]